MGEEEIRTRTFGFEAHQVTVGDAALLLDITTKDVLSLIHLKLLRAEGKKPYKIDIRSLLEYKKTWTSDDDEED